MNEYEILEQKVDCKHYKECPIAQENNKYDQMLFLATTDIQTLKERVRLLEYSNEGLKSENARLIELNYKLAQIVKQNKNPSLDDINKRMLEL